MVKISAYWKTVVAGLTPVLVVVQTATDDGRVDVGEGLAIAGALLIAFGVWRVPNKPKDPADVVSRYRNAG